MAERLLLLQRQCLLPPSSSSSAAIMGYAWDIAVGVAAVIGVVATVGSFVTGAAVMCGWKPFASKQTPATPPLVLRDGDRKMFRDLLISALETQQRSPSSTPNFPFLGLLGGEMANAF